MSEFDSFVAYYGHLPGCTVCGAVNNTTNKRCQVGWKLHQDWKQAETAERLADPKRALSAHSTPVQYGKSWVSPTRTGELIEEYRLKFADRHRPTPDA